MEKTEKFCPTCEQTKPIGEFGKHSSAKDGYRYQCKSCNNAYDQKLYNKDIEKSRARSRKKARKPYSQKNYEYNKIWVENNPDKVKANKERFVESRDYDEYKKRSHLRYNYDMTLEEYNEMFQSQNGRCAICKTDKPLGPKNVKFFSIDHCHTTGFVRGLLCSKCNHGLGQFNDNVDLLKEAIAYLEKVRSRLVEEGHVVFDF
jgi:hypothetical protein